MTGATAQATFYAYSVPSSGYSANGNLTAVDDTVMGHWAYGYDGLNRLSTGQSSASTQNGAAPYNAVSLSWNYDSFGNNKGLTASGSSQASITQATYTFAGNSFQNGKALSATTNRLDGYIYDAGGNLLGDGASAYTT